MTAEAYSIIGADRPSRWLVTCDHATNRVPDWVGGGDLGIAAPDMARHIAYDVGAAGLTRALAQRLDAPAILSDFSRLVIDPNRGEDDPTLLMRIYDGTVIPANRHAGAAEREERLDRLYRPYHTAYERLAAKRPDGAICAIHSFTRQLRGRPRRPWAVGVLYSHKDERLGPALWLSSAKLVLHPLAVGVAALMVFGVEPYAAGVMIAAASLPVAGNVYILAQHFAVAVHRVSAAILISTAISIATVPAVIHWITKG